MKRVSHLLFYIGFSLSIVSCGDLLEKDVILNQNGFDNESPITRSESAIE